MGTRHLIAVVKDNEYKVAQYGQFDGYPSGKGLSVLQFLDEVSMERFARKIEEVAFISEEELRARWVSCGASPDNDWVTHDVAEKFAERYPENSRETSAEVLRIIAESNHPIRLSNSLGFAADSLFCEWGYVIDLDKHTFEIYKGYNKKPLDPSERFAFLKGSNKDSEYTPITLVATYSLDALPTEKAFLVELGDEDEEEEGA